MTDPIADMLTRIRNAYMAGRNDVLIPHSKMKESITAILKDSNYINDYQVVEEGGHKNLKVALKYITGRPAINKIERISKPGRRIYTKANNLPRPLSGYGLAIISTSQGIMPAKQARQNNLGGELICKVW